MRTKGDTCLYKSVSGHLGLSGVVPRRPRSPACSVFGPKAIEGLWLRTALVKGPDYPKSPPPKMCNPEDIVTLMGSLSNRATEEFVVIPFDSAMRPRGFVQVGKGGAANAPVDVAEVARVALLAGSDRLVVVHNHPSADPTHSADDRRVVGRLTMALNLLGITLEDSIVVAQGGKFESFQAIGALQR